MKCTDGLFLDVAREIAKEYPQIEFTDSIVDAMCMRLVMHPEEYDVLFARTFTVISFPTCVQVWLAVLV